MSDIDLAVKASKQIESTLVRVYGAKGKGLHEKVSSVEKKLPASLVKRIRYVATIRNKILHDDDYRKFDDRSAFKSVFKQIKRELKRLEGKSSPLLWVLMFVLFILLGAVALVYYFELLDWLL